MNRNRERERQGAAHVGEHSKVDCYSIPSMNSQRWEPNTTKRMWPWRTRGACCIIDLSRWYFRGGELELIGPDPHVFPKLSVTREDGSLLITTNGTFHLHGSYQRNSTEGVYEYDILAGAAVGTADGGSRPFPSVRVSSGSWKGCWARNAWADSKTE